MPPASEPPGGRDDRTVIGSRAPRASPGSRAPGLSGAFPGRPSRAPGSAFDPRTGRGGAQLQPGDVLNNTHSIEALIARGGMGEIYRATNLVTGDVVAVKTMRPEFAGDPKISELFRREGTALRKVRNSAVVYYEGAFFDDTGQHYLVMEFVDGPSLAAATRTKPLTPAEVRALRDRLAAGLASAHAEGVIHRDISPDNVILPGGRLEDAKLIDFGIAKQQASSSATVIGGDFAGKFGYVAPEQLGLYGGKVDARSDIYSLGLVLAQVASGRPLDMGDSPATAVQARQRVPDLARVPAELRDEIASLLQPDPADRPDSMTAIIGVRPRRRPKGGAGRRSGLTGVALKTVAAAIGVVVIVAAGWLVIDAVSPPLPGLPRPSTPPSIAQAGISPPAAPPAPVAPAPAPVPPTPAPPAPQASPAVPPAPPPQATQPAPTAQPAPPAVPQTTPTPPPTPPVAGTSTPTDPPPTEVAALPPVNLTQLRTQIGHVLANQSCPWLGIEVGEQANLTVHGFAPRGQERFALVGELQSLAGVRSIDDRRVAPSWPVCDLLQVVRQIHSPDLRVVATRSIYPARGGEPLALRVHVNDRQLGLLTAAKVMVVNADGMVSQPPSWAQLGISRVLRFEGAAGAPALVPGPAVVVAIVSPRPLFAAARPASEPAAQFFAALRQTLAANPGSIAAYTIVNIAQ